MRVRNPHDTPFHLLQTTETIAGTCLRRKSHDAAPRLTKLGEHKLCHQNMSVGIQGVVAVFKGCYCPTCTKTAAASARVH